MSVCPQTDMSARRPPVEDMIAFIDDHRGAHGVEPICKVLPIAPSTYYDHLAKRANPARRSERSRRDEALLPEIERVLEANYRVYGVRKVWHQMRREGFDIARCTVARPMKSIGVQGIIRGKRHRTTIPDKSAPCPQDKVKRQFRVPAPDMLWVSDFTCVATWTGFVYVAFVVDAYARRPFGSSRRSKRATGTFRPGKPGSLCKRRLAREPHSPCRLRSRCPRTGRPPTATG